MTKSIPLKRISFNACYRLYLMNLMARKQKKSFQTELLKTTLLLILFVINVGMGSSQGWTASSLVEGEVWWMAKEAKE